MSKTKDAIQAILDLCESIEEVVQAAGPLGKPSGELYALLMGPVNIHQYQTLINIMVNAGRLQTKNHLLFLGEKSRRKYETSPTTTE